MLGSWLALRSRMACPLYQQRGTRCRCLAVIGNIVPTMHERETYCWKGQEVDCPTYRANVSAGRPLSEQQYMDLWTGPVKQAG